MKKALLYSFCAIASLELISVILKLELVEKICKPLIMISLIGYYIISVYDEKRSKPLMLAMFFSLAGDALLMFQDTINSFFILGLLAFLFSHVFYIFTYRQQVTKNDSNGLQGIQRVRFSFPFILAGTGLIVVLYPFLGELKVPVIFYAVVLIVMVLNALFRYGHTTVKSFWMVFFGAVFFMLSDSLLAINKFLSPVSNGVWIMLTYIAAQFLIVQGLIDHSQKR